MVLTKKGGYLWALLRAISKFDLQNYRHKTAQQNYGYVEINSVQFSTVKNLR